MSLDKYEIQQSRAALPCTLNTAEGTHEFLGTEYPTKPVEETLLRNYPCHAVHLIHEDNNRTKYFYLDIIIFESRRTLSALYTTRKSHLCYLDEKRKFRRS